MTGSQDQSMEEILQSIKRIIAEEGDDAAVDESVNSLANSNSVKGSDILEMSDILEEDEPLELEDMVDEGDVASALLEEMDAVGEDVSFGVDESITEEIDMASEDVFLSAGDDAVAEGDAESVECDILDNIDSLLSEEAAKTTANAFHRVVEAKSKPVEVKHDLAFRSGTTVEDLTMELLKPLMKQWLDVNLPPLVERLVEQEIRRLAEA